MYVLQVTIVYVLDAAECLPTIEEWPSVWQEQEAWRKAKKAATKQVTSTECIPKSEKFAKILPMTPKFCAERGKQQEGVSGPNQLRRQSEG